MKKKLTNKEVWKKWIKRYNRVFYEYDGYSDEKKVEKRFFNIVPKEQRNLMAALLSCLKWHPMNLKNKSELCGLCFLHNSGRNTVGTLCKKCPLYKKLGDACSYYGLFDRACLEKNRVEFGQNSQLLFDTLLEIYKKEYEKVFGKDWVDWEKTP